VKAFNPAAVTAEPAISTALPVGVATYLAMESFEGSVGGLTGAFNFVHSASTSGPDRTAEYFAIVPSSGTGQLAGITGDGGLAVDPDGTHRIWLEYQIGGVTIAGGEQPPGTLSKPG
jgi:hypothetical protein